MPNTDDSNMMNRSSRGTILLLTPFFFASVVAQDTEPDRFAEQLRGRVETLTQQIEASPDTVQLFSSRGDAWFFLGEFENALTDYSQMVELSPQTDNSHWRRGIAFFYVGDYEKAAAQFDRYHSFDNVDRENGIWRYLSHFRAHGAEAARKQLLKYDKDDREPFGDVYKLFSGEMSGQEILKKIHMADISDVERAKRLFYAHLYIGLNDAVHERHVSASENLKLASENQWARKAGYGPSYMWHVGRLHAELIQKQLDSTE